MARSERTDHGGTIWGRYDAHLTQSEDTLEAHGQRTDPRSGNTPRARAARTDRAKDKLAAAAR